MKVPLPGLTTALALLSWATAPAAVVTWAGTATGIDGNDNDEVDSWRTIAVAKTYDTDGDNVYGTAGYVFYGADSATNGNGGAVVTVDPLAYNASATRRTHLSVPSYLSLTSTGQNRIASSYGYRLMDDPTQPPSASVANVESGGALRQSVTLGTEVGMINFTVTSAIPAGGLRIGVIISNLDAAAGTLRFTQTTGGAATSTANLAFSGSSIPSIVFFDVTEATTGDVFSLFLTKSSPGNSNTSVAYGGLTFDVIPEPGSAMLGLLAAATLGLRRRRH
ncbi:hypothetical protein OVA24_00695 [Luteolibacter sp. SL250]|uniref:hypothetical protein n=1 Tax=Luteolibacter sp. SL250 TaxID=2995170 RepID=UPI00226D8A77|nr:hypothetical protein [Luteolibacter sp. SL250]WAC19894.1 hypothetical protein OVA24_00695 [Luteolibacter sp. SL250]